LIAFIFGVSFLIFATLNDENSVNITTESSTGSLEIKNISLENTTNLVESTVSDTVKNTTTTVGSVVSDRLETTSSLKDAFFVPKDLVNNLGKSFSDLTSSKQNSSFEIETSNVVSNILQHSSINKPINMSQHSYFHNLTPTQYVPSSANQKYSFGLFNSTNNTESTDFTTESFEESSENSTELNESYQASAVLNALEESVESTESTEITVKSTEEHVDSTEVTVKSTEDSDDSID
jgi:hypothetical protein